MGTSTDPSGMLDVTDSLTDDSIHHDCLGSTVEEVGTPIKVLCPGFLSDEAC